MTPNKIAPYTLAELAKEWKKEEDEILKYIESYHLIAIAWYDDACFEQRKFPLVQEAELFDVYDFHWRGWVYVGGNNATLIRIHGETSIENLVPHQDIEPVQEYGSRFISDGTEIKWRPNFYKAVEIVIDGDSFWKKGRHIVKREDLAIIRKEEERFRKSHPDLFSNNNTPETPAYLDNKLKEHAPKLAAAIAAWEAVALKPLPRNMTPKKALIDWLKNHIEQHPKALMKSDGTPNNEAIREIAKVANWKFGGASKTEI